MKNIIHINQHNIKHNNKILSGKNPDGEMRPVITSKTYKENTYSNGVDIIKDGQVVATIKYSPNKPLSCGAHVWIEVNTDVVDVVSKD